MDQDWIPIPNPSAEAQALATQFDLRYEVIDPVAGRVLASGVLDDGRYSPLYHFVSGTNISYRPVFDSDELASLEFFDLKLIHKQEPLSLERFPR
jgi:hypothetical protein